MSNYLHRKEKSTKKNPYTFHFLRRRLLDLDGLSNRIEVRSTANLLLKRRCGLTGKHLVKKNAHDKSIKGNEGNKITKIDKDYIYLLCGISIERTAESLYDYQLTVNSLRPLDTFPSWSKVKQIGTYRDYEKGGWYSTIPLYELNGEYFADSECSQTMNAVYSEQNKLTTS